MSNRTFTMIKPDAFSKGYSGLIIDKIAQTGFKVIALKLTKLSAEKAGEFYAIHKERGFFQELVDFMSSGPIVAAILEKDNAVADFRKLTCLFQVIEKTSKIERLRRHGGPRTACANMPRRVAAQRNHVIVGVTSRPGCVKRCLRPSCATQETLDHA